MSSKSLENEYKNLIANDIPDLWDRIESGLEERKINETIVNVDDKKVTKNKSFNRLFIYIPTLSMVALAALAVIPITLLFVTNRQSKTTDCAPMAAEMSLAKSFEENATDSMNDEAAESIWEESATCDEAAEYKSEVKADGNIQAMAGALEGNGLGVVSEEAEMAPTEADALMPIENDVDYTLWIKGAEIEVLAIVEEDGQTLIEGYYIGSFEDSPLDDEQPISKGQAFSGYLSKDSLVQAITENEYVADVYIRKLADGSKIYEYVLQSSRR